MKTITLALTMMFLATAVFSQSKADELVKFKETEYDFGKIKQGVPVNHEFVFTNISNQPVVVESAVASCGCTTPVWPQAPISKGKSDKIKAGFNAAAPETFTKQITVKLAGVNQPLQLTIKGEVLSAADYAKFEQSKAK